jgi:hypothetical protein
MNEIKWLKKLIVLAALVLVGALVWQLTKRGDADSVTSTEEVVPITPHGVASNTRQKPELKPVESMPEENEDGPNPLAVPREKVDAYLAKHNRSAASLLAGYHALQDTNLLNEAAAKFPNDPYVQWAMLTSEGLGGEQRRQWLEAFKTSSPDNSLANYLSSAEHFKAGNQEAAIKELLIASGKKQFKDFAMEAMIDEQELHRFAGQSAMMAVHAHGWADDLVGQLAPMKVAANGIAEAHAKFSQGGDATSAENLKQIGFGLAERMESGDGGKFLISQMVGSAIEHIMFKDMDPNTPHESLGGQTPAQRQAEWKQQRAEYKKLMPALSEAYNVLSESELVSYSDRMKAHGELEALRWLQQRVEAAKTK